MGELLVYDSAVPEVVEEPSSGKESVPTDTDVEKEKVAVSKSEPQETLTILEEQGISDELRQKWELEDKMQVDDEIAMEEFVLPGHKYVVETIKEDNEYIITIVVDPDWIQSDERVWPVVVDPTWTMAGTGTTGISDVTVFTQATRLHKQAQPRRYDYI